jgi:hypothetical protein
VEAIDKADIIMEFVQRKADVGVFDDFFAYNDLGIPLAVAVKAGLCELNAQGNVVLDETYAMLLTELGIDDLDKEYKDLDEVLEDSDIEE